MELVGWGESVGATHACWPARFDPCHLPPVPAATNRLFLFYSESRKSLSPGGDIKVRAQQAQQVEQAADSQELAAAAQAAVKQVQRQMKQVQSKRQGRVPTTTHPPAHWPKAGHCV